MPFDGVLMRCLTNELDQKLRGGRIDKIYMPQPDELIINIRSLGKNHKLYLTCNASMPRIHLTEYALDNPTVPPNFCMLLRKYLSGGKLTHFKQIGLERALDIGIEGYNELGDIVTKRLIIEIMGRHSNIILVNNDGLVADAVKHIDFTVSSVRQILPHLPYLPPPAQDKASPLEVSLLEIENIVKGFTTGKCDKQLLNAFIGLSPLLCRELVYNAFGQTDVSVAELNEDKINALAKSTFDFFKSIKENQYSPNIIIEKSGKAIDYCALRILQYGDAAELMPSDSISTILDSFYTTRAAQERMRQSGGDLLRIVTNLLERCARKAELQRASITEAEGRDRFKLFGDIITANIYRLQKGDSCLTAQNYYDPDLKEIDIPLDLSQTPSQNAQGYYNKYNKLKNTALSAAKQLELTKEELIYLEGVQTSLQHATDVQELKEIKAELIGQGYIKGKQKPTKGKGKKSVAETVSSPYLFKSSDGFTIVVGKNNKQNDLLTLKTAKPHDIWLHTKNIPGSHTVIFTNKQPVPILTIEEAAGLAAYYSRATSSANVAVDYTEIRNVKKPSGARPGMVIYVSNKTAYVTPDESLVKRLKA